MIMKSARPARAEVQATPATTPMQRRGLVFGVGAAGAAALAVKLVPGAPAVAAAARVAKAVPALEQGGYRLSAHVQRYYETTRS